MPDRRWVDLQRRKLMSELRRFGPWLDKSWVAMFPRRHPAFALWIYVFVCVGLAARVWTGPPQGPDYHPTEQDLRVEWMAKVAVERALDLIGHGVRVDDVRVWPLEHFVLAQYIRHSNSIEFAAGVLVSAEEVELAAAHEAVHALFHQADLNPYADSPVWDTRLLVEETAAEVLSAHIVGHIRARRGIDGEPLTRRCVGEYRLHCTWSPGGRRRFVWLSTIHNWPSRPAPDSAVSIAVHFGSPERVDAMDRICRENPDPWVAAHVIAERYIEPIPEPAELGNQLPADG